ncbi:MAG: helix-turn-helix transcriptional regulator [Roseiarcus sp.]|uniref:helix-turn-helix transcriptional regulator n=1 Tax=Roseiarcus sp. TaxID=1969460 RepID=UPI003C4E8DC5
MSGEPPALVVAIEVGEPELADRLAALLADVPGLRLAAPGEPADATLVAGSEPAPDVALTPRELDVLALIAEGASNKAIARRLGISVHTVKFHIASLLDKLDAQGRAEAVAQGARLRALRL